MMGAAEQIKRTLADLGTARETMNPDGPVSILDYCDDCVTQSLSFFKGGEEVEKVLTN